ncbi:hypothetical protein BKA69DRAFT_469474 [Paraphysoderma sedebokerense]|nr:hypothetical protein BKA69DRAFT_469474 [Paraphysoderma sedebokerense]
MKNTPTTHPDYPVLGQALLKVETVVTIVNEAGRQTEAIHKMLKLQTSFTTKVNIVSPTRQYIGAQTFDIMEYGSGANAAGKNSREVIMFNDMMVVAKVERAGKNDDKKYKHIGTIPYDTAILEVMSEQFEIQVPEEKRYYLFLCPDNESKVTWADKITKLIKAHRQQSRTPSQAVTSSPGQNTRAASMIVGQGSPVSAALAKELKNTNADHSSERDSDSGINVSSATSASSNTPPNTSRSNSQVLPSVSTPPQDQLTTLLSSSPALSNTKGPAKLTQMTSLVEDPEDIETHTESPSESASISESTTPALILPEMNIEETDSESNEHVTDQTSENRVQFLATPPPQLTLAISLGNLSFDGFSDPIDSEPETEEADQKSDKQGFGLLLPPPPKLTLALSSGNLSFDGIAGPIEFETTSNATDQKSENQKIESQKPKLESTPQQTLAVASVNVSSELNSSHYSLDELIGSQGSTHEALVTAEQNPSEVATEVNENEGSQISIDKIAGNQDSSHDILSDLINSQPEISIEASESRGSRISIDRIARDQISSYDIPSESVISMPQSSVEASTNEGGPISIDQIAAKQESCNNNPSESVTSPPESSKEVTESEGNRISIDKIVEDKDSSHDIASDSVPSPPESSIEASEREGSRISIDQIAAKQDSSHDIPSELVTSPPESSIEASESKGSLISIDKIAAKQDSSHNIPLDSVTSPPEISIEASESKGSLISIDKIVAKQNSSDNIPPESDSLPERSIEVSESEGKQVSIDHVPDTQESSQEVHTQVDSDSSTVVLIEAPSSANTLSTSTLSVERPSIRERSRTAPLNTPSTLRNQISFNDPSPAASTEVLANPSSTESEEQEKPSGRLTTDFENKNSFSAPTSPIEKATPPELTRNLVSRNRPASAFVGSSFTEFDSNDKINASSTTLKELDDEDERNERSGESVTDIPEKLLSRRSTQQPATSFSKPIMSSIIIGVYKPSEQTKDYIYVTETTHVSVAQSFLSFHTFDDFFDFHLQLIGHFPEEAGLNVHNLITLPKSLHSGHSSADTTEKPRIIPEFPPQMMMVNDAIARARLLKLQEYLNVRCSISQLYCISDALGSLARVQRRVQS